ncbi:MAG: hypothetical protein KBT68_09390, partial [bacterium]|nr:hypothetical protein [Candidatus Colisoma equi]
LENIVLTNAFGTADAELVTVAAGGTLALGEGVVLYGRITTEAADGLLLAGELKSAIFLDCKASPEICQAFGTVESGAEDAVRASATNIVNWAEESGEIVGVANEDDTLRWDERPSTLADAVGFYVTDGGATPTLSRRLDWLVARYAFADVEASIVLLADDTLTLSLTLGHDLELSAPAGTNIAITVAPTACFKVSEGASMSVAGISFEGTGEQGNGLFLVDGGELTLGEGTRLSGLIGTSSDLGNPNSGAVNVMSGSVTLKDGAEISGCSVTSYYNRPQNGYGGGVYLNGEGCQLVLAGGRIICCRAQTYGGGVYACKGSTVSLSGETTVIGNCSGNDTVAERRADDIYMSYAELGDFTLDGPVSGKIGVRWGESSTDRNVAGTDFITVNAGVDPTSSLPMFISDVNPGLVAGKGAGVLTWGNGQTEAKYLLTVVANDLTKFEGAEDPELTYSVFGQKNPPPALAGVLERAEGEEVGTYAISQGTLDVFGTDYRLVFVEGTFTIVESPLPPPPPPPPGPEYTVTTNDPSLTPLAFSAIERVAETEWKLSVTNLLKDAEYALSYTPDLLTPFKTGEWFRAESGGLWTTNWLFASEEAKPAYFWRAHGRTTYVTNWLNAVQPQP